MARTSMVLAVAPPMTKPMVRTVPTCLRTETLMRRGVVAALKAAVGVAS